MWKKQNRTAEYYYQRKETAQTIIANNSLIRISGGMVNFVDQNIIEIIFAELCENFRPRHGLYGGEHIFTIVLFTCSGK